MTASRHHPNLKDIKSKHFSQNSYNLHSHFPSDRCICTKPRNSPRFCKICYRAQPSKVGVAHPDARQRVKSSERQRTGSTSSTSARPQRSGADKTRCPKQDEDARDVHCGWRGCDSGASTRASCCWLSWHRVPCRPTSGCRLPTGLWC